MQKFMVIQLECINQLTKNKIIMKIKIISLIFALVLIRENTTNNIPEIMQCDNKGNCWLTE